MWVLVMNKMKQGRFYHLVFFKFFYRIMPNRTFKEIFAGKQSILEEKIDTKYGLLAKLVQHGVITNSHRSDIEVRIGQFSLNKLFWKYS